MQCLRDGGKGTVQHKREGTSFVYVLHVFYTFLNRIITLTVCLNGFCCCHINPNTVLTESNTGRTAGLQCTITFNTNMNHLVLGDVGCQLYMTRQVCGSLWNLWN